MSKDIKQILMSEIDSLISGKTDIKRARAVTKLAAQVVYKDRLAMEEKVLTAKTRLWFKEK